MHTITYYLLPITYYLLPITYYLLPITYYLLPITYYLLPITLTMIADSSDSSYSTPALLQIISIRRTKPCTAYLVSFSRIRPSLSVVPSPGEM